MDEGLKRADEDERPRGKPAPSGSAVYHVRVVVTDQDDTRLRSPLTAPSVDQIEKSIMAGIRRSFPKLWANAEATRTDI